jgi:glycosyltransferase involved in cell wall biosynthesis
MNVKAKTLDSRSIGGTRPVKVVRIIDRLNIGGPAKHVVWLTAGLNRDEFETTLITGTIPPGEGDMAYFARSAGVEPVTINEMSRELSLRDLIVIAKLVLKLWRLRPDVIHTHKAKAGAAGRAAAFIYKWVTPSALLLRPRPCRVIHTYHGHIFHGYYGPAKTKLFVLIERAMARICTDRIIVLSAQQKEEILGRFRVGRPDQFQIVPLGIDFDEVADQAGRLRAEISTGEEELLIGIVGRLCEVKNQSMFLKGAALLGRLDSAASPGGTDACCGVRFVIIGDGPLRTSLENEARDAGIAERVSFTGFRKDAGSLYRDLDVVALTSVNEGTPLTIIEALAAGRPVVATEVGGVVDLMGARQYQAGSFWVWDHGITVPSGDAAAFANALKFLIGKPELRGQMGERGKAFARSRMSRNRLIKDIEALYFEMMTREPATSSQVRAAI